MEALLARVEHETSRQLALVTREQLRIADVSGDQIRGLVARRVLERMRPRVYAIVGAPRSWEQGLLAAVLSCGAVASHASAARIWSFAHRPDDRFEVSVARDRFPTLSGVQVHRTRHLQAVDIARCQGIPCTSFERTLCDITTQLSQFQLSRTLDDGLRRGVVSLRRLEACARRLESGPGRHMSVVRALLAERGRGYHPGGSGSELRVLKVLKRSGLPLPVQQHRVRIDGRRFYPDFAWPEHKVFAEYYGLPVHMGASAVVYDSERVTIMSSHGWLPLIFTDATPDRVIVERTATALAERADGRITGTSRR